MLSTKALFQVSELPTLVNVVLGLGLDAKHPGHTPSPCQARHTLAFSRGDGST
jgi:hypothetical protein